MEHGFAGRNDEVARVAVNADGDLRFPGQDNVISPATSSTSAAEQRGQTGSRIRTTRSCSLKFRLIHAFDDLVDFVDLGVPDRDHSGDTVTQ